MPSGLPDHVYSVLIGIADDMVLLPNSAVAEVAGQESLSRREGVPDWWIGQMEWRGRKLPVVSMEALMGHPVPAIERRCRLVVMNTIGDALDSGQYAMLTQSYPLLVTLNEAAIKPVAQDGDEAQDYVLTRVEFANRQALIPNLRAMEEALQQALESARV